MVNHTAIKMNEIYNVSNMPSIANDTKCVLELKRDKVGDTFSN